jgi:hypothetical protein
MKIGVAIPCYQRHIYLLKRLLDSLEHQIRKPDVVSVSCSSMSKDIRIPVESYSFPVIISYYKEYKNAAQNRNIAVAALLKANVDIISFFDADDIMHPQRLQAIEAAFAGDVMFVLHSYTSGPQFKLFSNLDIAEGGVVKDPNSICLKYESFPIQHAHVSLRSSCMDTCQFREEESIARAEDSIFCRELLHFYGSKNAFLCHPLASYVGEHQTFSDEMIVESTEE